MRPTNAETRYLELGYNRFYDLYEEITSQEFWDLEPTLRFSKVKDIFSIYTELVKYEPLKVILTKDEYPHSKLILGDLMRFVRNLLQHFPFFEEWDEVYIDTELISAIDKPGSIHKFLSKKNHPYDTKYRIWNPINKSLGYVSINLNTGYSKGHAVFLSDILNEKDGVNFACIAMKNFLDTQVERLSVKYD